MPPPKKPKPKPKAKAKLARPAQNRLYSLDVCIISGPIAEKFAKKNPQISRVIQIRGDQTLEDLHDAIFDAFDREEEHMYEFQFGEYPMDRKAARYVMPTDDELGFDDGEAPSPQSVDLTTLASLNLKVGRSFGYWFDYGDDWWHQIDVVAIDDKVPRGKFPKVAKKVGKSPPQYADPDE